MSGLTPQLVRERVRGTILERIGETPLVPLHRIGAGLRGELWAKIESANPGGSVKDRPGLWMVLAAEEEGRLRRSRTVLDATSGNTGVALAMVCAVRGHALELCMPDKASIERKRIIRAFGAKLVLTDPLEGTDGAIREAQRMAAAERERYVYVDQYSNPANPLAHQLGTGPEIWEQTARRVTHFVAGVGTSGTIVGGAPAEGRAYRGRAAGRPAARHRRLETHADRYPSRDLGRTRRRRASGHGDRRGDRHGQAARARGGDLQRRVRRRGGRVSRRGREGRKRPYRRVDR